MTRSEVVDQIAAELQEAHCFIRLWEAGQKFIDIDLIERFLCKRGEDREIEGFELLDLEQMWQILIELDPDMLTRVRCGSGEIIEWVWKDSTGLEKKTVYPFNPEGIKTIIDDEFFA